MGTSVQAISVNVERFVVCCRLAWAFALLLSRLVSWSPGWTGDNDDDDKAPRDVTQIEIHVLAWCYRSLPPTREACGSLAQSLFVDLPSWLVDSVTHDG